MPEGKYLVFLRTVPGFRLITDELKRKPGERIIPFIGNNHLRLSKSECVSVCVYILINRLLECVIYS